MALTLLSIEEAAERYHLPLEQLRAMVDDGRIVPVAVNGHVLLDDDEVRKVAGNNGNHLHWMPLKEAAARYALEETLLDVLVKEGKVRSGTLADEPQVAIEDIEPIATRLNRANFRKLESQPIVGASCRTLWVLFSNTAQLGKARTYSNGKGQPQAYLAERSRCGLCQSVGRNPRCY